MLGISFILFCCFCFYLIVYVQNSLWKRFAKGDKKKKNPSQPPGPNPFPRPSSPLPPLLFSSPCARPNRPSSLRADFPPPPSLFADNRAPRGSALPPFPFFSLALVSDQEYQGGNRSRNPRDLLVHAQNRVLFSRDSAPHLPFPRPSRETKP